MAKKTRIANGAAYSLPDDPALVNIAAFPPYDGELASKAREMTFEAMGKRGLKTREKMARKPLSISPWMADAWRIPGDVQTDVKKAIPYYEIALEVGKAVIGDDFKKIKGEFWGWIETRPYMRAKDSYAIALGAIGDKDGQIAQFQEMLELNPNDNQGVRDTLLPLLFIANRSAEAAKLIKQYEDDCSASWHWGKALLAFRENGKSAEADKALDAAMEENRFVQKYLTGKRKMPKSMPSMYSMGSEEEAVYLAWLQKEAWDKTEGAIEWLKEKPPVRLWGWVREE